MKVFSTSLCFGLLALLSVMNLLKSVHGQPHLVSGHELFPAKEPKNHEKLLLLALLSRNPSFQRNSHAGADLPSKSEDLRQLRKLKGRLIEGKDTELSHSINTIHDNVFSSYPNKRACFWKYCV